MSPDFSTSRNSRFAFTFLAIVLASFHVILQNFIFSRPKPSSRGDSPRRFPSRNAWPHDPPPSGVGVVAFSSLAQLGGDRPSADPTPFGSRSAETATTSAKSASWRFYHSSPFTAAFTCRNPRFDFARFAVAILHPLSKSN